MSEGSVIFSIWTPSSSDAATAAYVLPLELNMAMKSTVSSFKSAPPSSSPILPSRVMLERLVIFSMWKYLSVLVVVTAAYVWVLNLNMASPTALVRLGNFVASILPAAVMR